MQESYEDGFYWIWDIEEGRWRPGEIRRKCRLMIAGEPHEKVGNHASRNYSSSW